MSLGCSPFQLCCAAWVWESDAASRGVCIGWPEPGSGLYCLFADLLLSPLAVHLTRTTGPMTVRPTPTVLFRRNVHHGSYASSMGFVSGRISVVLQRLTHIPHCVHVVETFGWVGGFLPLFSFFFFSSCVPMVPIARVRRPFQWLVSIGAVT